MTWNRRRRPRADLAGRSGRVQHLNPERVDLLRPGREDRDCREAGQDPIYSWRILAPGHQTVFGQPPVVPYLGQVAPP